MTNSNTQNSTRTSHNTPTSNTQAPDNSSRSHGQAQGLMSGDTRATSNQGANLGRVERDGGEYQTKSPSHMNQTNQANPTGQAGKMGQTNSVEQRKSPPREQK